MPGPIRPEDLLPDGQDHTELRGVAVRKGTIGAFLANVQALGDLPADAPERAPLVAELRASIPLLRSLGLLEIFAFRDPALAELLGAEGAS